MWSMAWAGVNTTMELLLLDRTGRLYLSNAQFQVDGKTRKGVVCFSE